MNNANFCYSFSLKTPIEKPQKISIFDQNRNPKNNPATPLQKLKKFVKK